MFESTFVIVNLPWTPFVIIILVLAPLLILVISSRRHNSHVLLSSGTADIAHLVEIEDSQPQGRSGRFHEFFVIIITYFILLSSIISRFATYPSTSFQVFTANSTIDNICEPPTGLDLLEAYGGHISNFRMPITISSTLGQQLFDQGLLHLYGFNQIEAIRNFQNAASLDQECAMCYWGIAAAYGPNINDIVSKSEYVKAVNAITTAKSLLLRRLSFLQIEDTQLATFAFLESMPYLCSDRELLLILSLGHRYPVKFNSTNSWNTQQWLELEKSYADALEEILRICPFDSDIATLRAEALLNLSPWQYFSPSINNTKPHRNHLGDLEELTPSALTSFILLRKVLFQPPSLHSVDIPDRLTQMSAIYSSVDSNRMELVNRPNPLALHLYIHLTEQLLHPCTRGVGAEEVADALFNLSLGKPLSSNNLRGERTVLTTIHHDEKTAVIGHLLHMPSHMYLRLGRYADCVETSKLAVRTDLAYVDSCVEPYFPSHNKALLVMCAINLIGGEATALKYATASATSMDVFQSTKSMMSMLPLPLVGVYPCTPLHSTPPSHSPSQELVYIRYGRYAKVLSLPNISSSFGSDPQLSFGRSIYYYARTLASAALGQEWAAETNLQHLESSVREVPPDSKPVSHVFYPYHRELSQVMLHMGKSAVHMMHIRAIIFKRQSQPSSSPPVDRYSSVNDEGVLSRLHSALEALQRAVSIQDSFSYMEPENFYLPIRQCLAAYHIFVCAYQPSRKEGGAYSVNGVVCNMSAAVNFYREDLEVHPKNDWAELGLKRASLLLETRAIRPIGSDEIDINQDTQMGHSPILEQYYYDHETERFGKEEGYIGSCCELALC